MPHFEQKLHQRRHFYILSHPQIIASTVFENYRESLQKMIITTIVQLIGFYSKVIEKYQKVKKNGIDSFSNYHLFNKVKHLSNPSSQFAIVISNSFSIFVVSNTE